MQETPGPAPPRQPRLGPAGQERSPILVPFLTYISLRFYLYYWIWQTSKEVERFDPERPSPHATARWGVPLVLAGLALFAAGVAVLLFSGAVVTFEDPLEGSVGTALAVAGTALVLGGLAFLAGSLLLWVSYWRVWKVVTAHERGLGYDPVNPSLMLVLWVGAAFVVPAIPLVGWAVQLGARSYVLYRTQRGLNRLWTGLPDRAASPSPRPPLAPGAGRGRWPGPGLPRPRAREEHRPKPGPRAVGGGEHPRPRRTVWFTCDSCGYRERVPGQPPVRIACPRCGRTEVLRGR